MARTRRTGTVLPALASSALILAACGTSGEIAGDSVAAPPPTAAAPAPVREPAPTARDTTLATSPVGRTKSTGSPPSRSLASASASGSTGGTGNPVARHPAAPGAGEPRATAGAGRPVEAAPPGAGRERRDAERDANRRIYDQADGATDTGVTRTDIKLGTVSMHGMALGSVIIDPIVRGIQATLASINDRGGILGRRLSLVDCDDGPGDVSRSKSCLKKLIGDDKIFSLLAYTSWASASVHDDLKFNKLPAVGTWAYSQTEWQDPYMFPTHMAMIHEAMAGANWVRDVVKPRTYGLLCLTSPEMQLACNQVERILNAAGAKLVKRIDVGVSETSMSAQVVAMRGANPDHIVHYVINAATLVKFLIEVTQQGYYPAEGISGNHVAAEALGALAGDFPAGRYWTNTTYKLWGPEFMATMNKYARINKGANHHIVQAAYVGALIFEQAAKQVGPNLTRARLIAALNNGAVWRSDGSLDQKFSYLPSERYGENWDNEMGQGREFMYKYTGTNTTANPDGSPSGFVPDPGRFVIHTR